MRMLILDTRIQQVILLIEHVRIFQAFNKCMLIYMLNYCNIVFTDCQYFFLCLNGKDARRNGCQVNWLLLFTFKLKYTNNQFLLVNIILISFLLQTGLLFNQKTQSCDRQENLAPNDPCRGYYNETFLEGLRGKIETWKLFLFCHIIDMILEQHCIRIWLPYL